MKIIGIAGASGAGKSSLAKKLQERVEQSGRDVKILNEDCYYRSQASLSLEQRAINNYDHPAALEHELMIVHLRQLIAGEQASIPQYDFTRHDRKSESDTISPPQILVVEGILILHHATLRSLLDLKIFVDVPLDICLIRRLRRDIQVRGREMESILRQYVETVRPMFHQFVKPTMDHADLVVPHGAQNTNAIDVLANYLSRPITDYETRTISIKKPAD